MKTRTRILPKLLLLLLTLCLAVAVFAACNEDKEQETADNALTEQTGDEQPHTHDYDETGVCRGCGERRPSEGLEYRMNADRAGYTVLGIGICSDIDVVIPATYKELPVTSIEANAFKEDSGLTSVTIGNGVTSIGDRAFSGCTGLTSVTIGNGVTSIGDIAFWGCTGLTSITIPDSVTSIGVNAFGNCSKLTYNTYDNAQYIGNPQNPYIVLIKALNTNILSCTIHGNTKSIQSEAFQGCTGLTSITIPNGVTSIGDGAFLYCTGLTSVTIPDSVTSIGDQAFYYCTGLRSVTIGNSVTSIGGWAFDGCTGLTSVTFTNTSGWYRTQAKGASSGTDMTVTNASTNAYNLKSNSYDYDEYWYYWYRK